MKLFVEGGGDTKALQSECRAGFSSFISKAGVRRRPRIVACGSRKNAYDSFCTAIENHEDAFLLVDSEAPVALEYQSGERDKWRPWQHLKTRPGDRWDKPAGSEDRHCHLMVQCMESWFLADIDTLSRFFGQGFTPNMLPRAADIESVDKAEIYTGLASSTKACKTKRPYGKGEHSFKLLALIDPTKVSAASPWAARFITELTAMMGA